MFIRKKGKSLYVVANHRVAGKVRQQIVACLGQTAEIDDALARLTFSVHLQREWVKESVSRPWNDDATRIPDLWRKDRRYVERKLGLDLDNFIARRRHISWLSVKGEHRVKYRAAFYRWADPQIDAYLQQKHEKDIEKQVRKLAKTESQLTRLWEIVPAADRPAMEAKVLEKVRQTRELRGYIDVVPSDGSELHSSGTTTEPDVVPEDGHSRTHSGTTHAPGNVVPEVRRSRRVPGTTYSEVP